MLEELPEMDLSQFDLSGIDPILAIILVLLIALIVMVGQLVPVEPETIDVASNGPSDLAIFYSVIILIIATSIFLVTVGTMLKGWMHHDGPE